MPDDSRNDANPGPARLEQSLNDLLDVHSPSKPQKVQVPSVLFTGFPRYQKEGLARLATAAGFKVSGSGTVPRSLGLLVVGPDPGPTKLQDAEALGIAVMPYEQFLKQVREVGVTLPDPTAAPPPEESDRNDSRRFFGKAQNRRLQPDDISVAVTGHPGVSKAKLFELAELAGLFVYGYGATIPKKLSILVVGSDPGPSTLAKAKANGARLMTPKEFFLFAKERIEKLKSKQPDPTDQPVCRCEEGDKRKKFRHTDKPGIKEDPAVPEALAVGDRINLPPGVFVAIDFETADNQLDSACALGAVVVSNGVVEAEEYRLIRPPREKVKHTRIHGLDWQLLKDQPTFCQVWADLESTFGRADYLVAHNAVFDRQVLAACCAATANQPPRGAFLCTLRGARAVLGGADKYPLEVLCARFDIPLRHHHALSDAKAVLRVYERLHKNGAQLDSMRLDPIQSVNAAASGKTRQAQAKTEDEVIKEFLVVTASLTCDDVLTPGEFSYLCQWLDRHERFSASTFLAPAFDLAREIMEDGIVTTDELEHMRETLEDLL